MMAKGSLTNWRAARKVREWQKAEQERVAKLIADARAARKQEKLQKQAELEVAEGVFVHLSDAVVEPTPEWLAKGESKQFSISEPGQTARSVKATRRVFTTPVVRLHRSGGMTEDQTRACLWYREMYEISGMGGRYSSGRLGPEMSLGSSSAAKFGGAGGHIPMTEHEAYARQMFRMARSRISPAQLPIFDEFVIDEMPVIKLKTLHKCRASKIRELVCEAAQAVAGLCDEMDFDLRGIGREIERP